MAHPAPILWCGFRPSPRSWQQQRGCISSPFILLYCMSLNISSFLFLSLLLFSFFVLCFFLHYLGIWPQVASEESVIPTPRMRHRMKILEALRMVERRLNWLSRLTHCSFRGNKRSVRILKNLVKTCLNTSKRKSKIGAQQWAILWHSAFTNSHPLRAGQTPQLS